MSNPYVRTIGHTIGHAIDYAALSLYVDDLDFVCLRVKIDNRDTDVLVRLGQPTARDLGKAMMEMAKPKEASDGF